MADPLSAIAGVIGILSSLVTLATPILNIVHNIKRAPGEIQNLSRDISAFFSVVHTLDVALRERDIRDSVENDDTMARQLKTLEESLRSCRDIILDVMSKHEGYKGKKDSIGPRKLKWAFFGKDEVQNLQLPLERMKLTLNNAMGAMTM